MVIGPYVGHHLGLITATILSLFVVPTLYLLLTKQEQAGEAALD